MADVAGGSDSPSMARSVLAWKNSNKGAAALWGEIGRGNEGVLRELRSGGAVGEGFREVRRKLKRMGLEAGVEIEPDCQTTLCDATMEIEGVVMSGVPGAGGVDAAFAVVRAGDEGVVGRVDELWEGWEGGGKVKRMGVEEGVEGGFRIEN